MQIEILSPRLSDLLPRDARVEQVATGFRFTEGPLWDPEAGALYFSDIPADRIYRWREGDGALVYREPSGKSNGLTWNLRGRLVACEHGGRRVSVTTPDGLAALVSSYGGRRLNSPNDLVFRSDGLLYFTDPPYGIVSADMGALSEQEQPVNGLYLLRPGQGEPELLAGDFDRPNGLAFAPDERHLYVADTPRLHVRVFDVEPDGGLAGGRVFAEFREEQGAGRPDGMKVDALGNLWTTGPGGVWVIDPDGVPLGHLRFPERTANCAWGEADLRSLYVTASTSVYRLRTLVQGIPPPRRR